jgi:hypothetical protein
MNSDIRCHEFCARGPKIEGKSGMKRLRCAKHKAVKTTVE